MADIQVSADQWNDVSADEREKIAQAFREFGLLKAGENIVPGVGIDALEWNPIKEICRIACDAAAASAIAWCTANTAGAGTVLCIAAANAAREECKRRC